VRRSKKATLIILLLLLVTTCWWWNVHRHVRIADAVNPAYWMRRWRGEDLYNPQTRFLSHGNRSLPEVALTIDDAPNSVNGAHLLDVLKAHHAHVTFFLIGENVKKSPNLVRRMLAEGHDLGNHSQSHLRLDELTPKQIRNEINNCDINYNRVTGRHLRLLRPPGMRYNKEVLKAADELGYTIVGYSWGARDYRPTSAPAIVREIDRRIENGSIIILHDEYPETAIALDEILDHLEKSGYRLVTVSEMLAHLPKPVSISEQKKKKP
jgi:peptidoglycan-N-acetylglucosamine deacetylase